MDESLKNIRKSKAEIGEDVTSIASYLPGLIRVFVPSSALNRIPDGWEASSTGSTAQLESINTETNLDRSIRRSRRTVVDLVICNPFELFCTFTTSNDRHNDSRSKEKMFNWLHNQRKRNGKFQYVIVPERHKDGALHFHAVIAGYTGSLKQSYGPKGKPIIKHQKPVYEFPEYKSGFNSAQKIGSGNNDLTSVARYLSKYLTKEMDLANSYKRRYWASVGLFRPITEYNSDWWENIKADFVYENEYGKQFIFSELESIELPEYVKLFTATGKYK